MRQFTNFLVGKMNYIRNGVISLLLVQFLKLSLVPAELEYTVVVDANKDPSSLNCSEDAFITIMDVSVKSEGYCKSASCIIDNSDHVVLRRLCENSTNCLIYGSNFSSACLLEQRRFDLSYLCEAPISLDCSFESDLLCHWEQGTDDDFDWTRHSGKTHTGNTGPDSDHTTNSKYGFYMYIESSGKDRNDIAQLISKPIVCKHVQCLTFWYHMYGNRIGSLYVYKKNRTQMDIVWERHGNQQNQWREAYMNLYCDEEFQIVIEGKIKDSFQRRLGDIALDDIYLFEGSCENGVKIICTFEDQQACGLNNAFDEPEYLSWTIEQDMATANGPAVDHTIGSENGFFFHLKSLEDSGKGRLESSLITFIGPKCLIIWYYIIGNNANNLTLYQMSIDGKREIMSVHGDTEENWKKSTISVYIALNDKIIIEGSIKQIGSISLDDISLSEGACIEDKEYNDSCLRINQQYEIEGCATLYLQRESLNITLHPSFTNSNNEKECTNQNEVGGELYNFCRDNYLYSNCKFNLETFYSDYSECFTFNKKILITYLCTDRKTTTVSSDSTSGDSSAVMEPTKVSSFTASREGSSAGLVVGLIIGALLLLCVVILIVVLIRRHTFKSNPREQIRNNLGGNDYIGSQDTALPLTANHSSHMQNNGMYDGSSNNSVHGYDSTNVNVQHEYTNVGAVNGFVNKEKVQVPTYAHRQVKTFADNHMSNDDEYAIVDPTAETSINETIGNRTGTADSYMVFDPTETGFNRQIFSNSPVGYEFAKPVKDTENKICDEDQYDISNEGIYDHSGSNRHKESDDNIYNHAVDTIYDSGSHKRNNERREDTYDHFFGQKTVDEYDVSTTT